MWGESPTSNKGDHLIVSRLTWLLRRLNFLPLVFFSLNFFMPFSTACSLTSVESLGHAGKQPINSPHKYKYVLTFTRLWRLTEVSALGWSDLKLLRVEGHFHSPRSDCSAVKILGGELNHSLRHRVLGPYHLGARSFQLPPSLSFSFIQLGIQQYNLDWSLQTIPSAYWATAPAFKF